MYTYYFGNSFDKPTPLVYSKFPKQSKAPVVLILGWIGSSIKYLTKYCDIYKKNGFECFVLCVTIDPTFIIIQKHYEILLNTLDLYIKLNPDTSYIITHSFSIGGIITGGIMKNINTYKKFEHLLPYFKGLVVDSGPPALVLDSLMGYFNSAKAANILLTPLCAFLIFLSPIYYYRIRYHYPYLPNQKNNIYNLILYSSIDIILNKSTKAFINDLKSNKIEHEYIRVVDFEDSKHCAHFIKYKERYNNEIQQLINKINNTIEHNNNNDGRDNNNSNNYNNYKNTTTKYNQMIAKL